MNAALKPRTVKVVFAECETTGRHASVTSMPMHEMVLARIKVQREGQESLIVHNDWPTACQDFQVQERRVVDEYNRLSRAYNSPNGNIFLEVYGQPHEGRFEAIINKIHEGFLKGLKLSQLIELGRPDGFMEITSLDAIEEKDIAPASAAKLPGAPSAEQSEKYSLDDASAAADEPAPVDGKLIDFLTGEGWEPKTAAAVARAVLEADGQDPSDAQLKQIRGCGNQAGLRKMRDDLTSFQNAAKAAI